MLRFEDVNYIISANVFYQPEEKMASTIKVCMGSSCFARGNSKNLQIIQNFLENNNISAEVELTGLRCCDCCFKGPNIIILKVVCCTIFWKNIIKILKILIPEKNNV